MSLSGCFLLQLYAENAEFKNFYPHDLLMGVVHKSTWCLRDLQILQLANTALKVPFR